MSYTTARNCFVSLLQLGFLPKRLHQVPKLKKHSLMILNRWSVKRKTSSFFAMNQRSTPTMTNRCNGVDQKTKSSDQNDVDLACGYGVGFYYRERRLSLPNRGRALLSKAKRSRYFNGFQNFAGILRGEGGVLDRCKVHKANGRGRKGCGSKISERR